MWTDIQLGGGCLWRWKPGMCDVVELQCFDQEFPQLAWQNVPNIELLLQVSIAVGMLNQDSLKAR